MRSLKEETPRPYRLRARADKQAETHRVLAEAAYALHTTVGPSKTTVSAIAERAGVQRLTVYRHFRDQDAIFAACTAHSFAIDPPPNPELWRSLAEPETRLRAALEQLYGYYRRNRQLLANLYRDAELPVVAAALARRAELLARGVTILRDGWPGSGPRAARLTSAAIGLALDFHTWQSLTEVQGLSEAEAIDTMLRLVSSASTGARARSRSAS